MASKDDKIYFLATLLSQYYDDIIHGNVLPGGGKRGQALVKQSDEDGDYTWSSATNSVDARKDEPSNEDVLLWFNIDETTSLDTIDVYTQQEVDNKLRNIEEEDIAVDKEAGKLYIRNADGTMRGEGIPLSDVGTNNASDIKVNDVGNNFILKDLESVLREIAGKLTTIQTKVDNIQKQSEIQIITDKNTPINDGAKFIIDLTEDYDDINNDENSSDKNTDTNNNTNT